MRVDLVSGSAILVLLRRTLPNTEIDSSILLHRLLVLHHLDGATRLSGSHSLLYHGYTNVLDSHRASYLV